MALMSYEQVKAVGVRKGDRVKFTNREGGREYEGVIVAISTKTVSAGKYFDASKNAWIDAGKVKRVYLQVQTDAYLMGEDQFHTLEIAEDEELTEPSALTCIEGQNAEELMFNWTRDDLREFAKELAIAGRGTMNKAQLAMAIENEVSL